MNSHSDPGQTGAPASWLGSDPRGPNDRSDHGPQGAGQGRARYRVWNAVAVITLDNPPVHALGPGMPRQIVRGLRRAQADERVRAVVITGEGSGFCAGADIRRLGEPWPAGEMGLAEVEERIARYRRSDVAWWRPVKLLGDLARRGLTFEAYRAV